MTFEHPRFLRIDVRQHRIVAAAKRSQTTLSKLLRLTCATGTPRLENNRAQRSQEFWVMLRREIALIH
jgi:hypothetical protein